MPKSHPRNGARSWYLAALVSAVIAALAPPSVRAGELEEGAPALYTLNADGTGWRFLFQLDGCPECSSPAVSPDGKTIAFDGCKLTPDDQRGPFKLFAVAIDGTNLKELCTGQAPSWSSDGKMLTCSRSTKPAGVWIVTAAGEEPKFIRPGWGAQWSPDGKKIAYYQGAKLMIYDVASGAVRQALGGKANPYKQLFWNMAWSPDSKRLCFKGARPDGMEELALIDVEGADVGLKVRFATNTFLPDIAWHPRGDRIVFSMLSPERQRAQLYELDLDSEEPPVLMAGQDENRDNYNPCWTPDGVRLIMVSRRP